MTHLLIVDSRFYEDIADELFLGASTYLSDRDITFDHLSVPGAFEIPAAIRMAMRTKKYDGYIALGCVIRGETTHYDYVCTESARALQQLAIEYLACIGYGILTVETEQQAWARARVTEGNKGAKAAEACIAMIAINQQLESM